MSKEKIFKTGYLIINIALLIITFALIPFNIFVANFDASIVIVLGILCAIMLSVYLVIFKTKLISKIILPIIFFVVIVSSSIMPFVVPYWNSYNFKDYKGNVLNYDNIVSYKAAKSDLDAMIRYIKNVHPMFLKGATAEVEKSYTESVARLKAADKITVNDLRREVQSILSPMRDAHTSTYNSFPGDAYLKVAPKKSSDGYKIHSVNGKTTNEIINAAKPYYSYEREDWVSVDLGSLASLDFYGFSSPFTFVWSNADGDKITEVYAENDFVPYSEYIEIKNSYFGQPANTDFVYYEIDEEKSLAVLTLTKCKYNQTYINCVKRMFTEVKEKNIQNVAIDIRGNGGGSSGVANEFIKYLLVEKYVDCPCDARFGFMNIHSDGQRKNKKYKELTFNGNVYALTDKNSFSAARDFAMMIQDNNLGKIIGEASANKVTSYGEVIYFYLPNTGIFLQVSSKKWYRANATNTDEYVMPDYPCSGESSLETLYGLLANL